MKQPASLLKSLGFVLLFASACGDDDDSSTVTPRGSGGSGASANGGAGGLLAGGAAGSGATDGGPSGGSGGGFPIGPGGIPVGFTKATIGAWKLGNRITASDAGTSGSGGSAGCGSVLTAVVRDFRDGSQTNGHPDFERDDPDADNALTGIVQSTLGADRKPVYAHAGGTADTASPAAFRQWYINNDSVNQTFVLHLFLQQQAGGKYTFYSNAFFPLDGQGFGNQGNEDGDDNPHNYHFTTEVHTEFRYNGGETFAFEGDDDLWVFINRRLAIDLGGLHVALDREINLDNEASRLGIARGNVYSLELFHAERHTVDSNFRIDTNLEFVNCGTIITDPVE
jgi:fibro-slime domain-containing protein